MASRVLPSDSLCLKTALLIGRVESTVPAPRRTSGVRVGQRLFTETSLKHRPAHTNTHTTEVLFSLFHWNHMIGQLLFILNKAWERIKQMLTMTKLIMQHNKHPKWVSVLRHWLKFASTDRISTLGFGNLHFVIPLFRQINPEHESLNVET